MPDLLPEIDRTIVQLGKKSCAGVHFSPAEAQQWRDIQQLLDIDHQATLVLGIIIALHLEGRGFSEDDLQEKTAQLQPSVQLRSAVRGLVDKGYLVRGDEERSEGGLHVSLALEGFLKTRQPHYLAICRTGNQHILLNKAMGWYKQERGHFMFESLQSQIFKSLVDHHNDPLARQLRRLSSQVYEQMALLATAAHSLAQQKSMDLGELVGDLFPNPVEQLLYSADWADPQNPLYTQNLLAPTQLIDGRVKRIQLHPKIEGKLIPEALRRSIRMQAPKSPYFEIIDHQSIQAIPLHYNKSFDTQRQQLIELLGEKRLRAYFDQLQAGGMVPGLQVMLTGAAGTGKTELVRQLARLSKRNLMIVRLEETRDKYFGENEKNISRLFSELTATARAMSRLPIILFNEADSFFYARANRGNSLENLENSIVTQFLNELERFEGILFATTNYTASMDKAYDRRWGFKLNVPSPDSAVRQLLIHKLFRDFASTEALNCIAAKHAFAPAQLNNVYRKLILHKPEQCNAELIEKLLLQELSGWARGRTPVGY
jgi:hypothetical protein